MPLFHLCRSTGQKVKTDTIWRPIIQRQAGVNMYGGSYVVNLFTQRVITKNDIFATAILHNNLFVIDSLTVVTAQVVHSHMY